MKQPCMLDEVCTMCHQYLLFCDVPPASTASTPSSQMETAINKFDVKSDGNNLK